MSAGFAATLEVAVVKTGLPKLKLPAVVVLLAPVAVFVVVGVELIPKENCDAVVTAVTPNVKPCTLFVDSFAMSPALSIPNLNAPAFAGMGQTNLVFDCDSVPGFAVSQAAHFITSFLFGIIHTEHSHVPAGFLNLSPNPKLTDGFGGDTVLGTKPGLLVSQA